MDYRVTLGLALLGAILTTPGLKAQTAAPKVQLELDARIPESEPSAQLPSPRVQPVGLERIPPGLHPSIHRVEPNPLDRRPQLPVRFHKVRFAILSAAVYTAAFLDMHQTLKDGPGCCEDDPLARPFLKLPPPAYYATGFAMATGVNWVSWKMAHSRRWHKLAPIPQLLAISGNLYGYQYSR